MSKDSLRQWSTTAASNLDVGGVTLAENTMKPSDVNNAVRTEMAQTAQYLVEMSYPTAGGTANALTLTPTTALAALASNQAYTFNAASANTTAATLAVSGLTAKAIRKVVGGTDVALAANDIQANGRYTVVYDTAANSAAGAWILTGTPPEVGVAIDGLTAKTTLVGGDEMIIADSATSFAGKKATLTNLLKMLNVSGNFNLALDLSGASAGQIVFPAAQNASAGANTLDDYEEGTFSAGISFGGGTTGITYSTQTGFYTKIGNVITVGINLTLSNKGSSTGNALITGLPFGVALVAPSGSVGLWTNMATITSSIPLVGSGTTLIPYNTGATSVAQLTNANFTNTSSLNIGLSYFG